MTSTVKIKKYSNRRLYDAEHGVFVTLGQVAEMIRQGLQVEVLEMDTGEDVTAPILIQIILDEAKKKAASPPPALLYMIIRYGEALRDFLGKYLELTFKNYLAHKAAVDEQFTRWLTLGLDFSAPVHEDQENPADPTSVKNRQKS
jgi:polyhydroxyalkanoate synthesis repressor PhaR